jgi:hypothetical protein
MPTTKYDIKDDDLAGALAGAVSFLSETHMVHVKFL